MSKEIVKAIFDENIAGAREDLTFDAYFDSIKGNEEYKKGLFENYVSDGTKSYDEFNAETFGMGKPEAPSEVGGAESSPTESVSSEFEVGPPAGGTPPGVEPKGAPVAEAAALVGEIGSEGEPKQDVEPAVITKDSLLDVFTVEDEKNKKGWWEKVVDFFTGGGAEPKRVIVGQETFDRLKARQDEEIKKAEEETGEKVDLVDVIQDFVTVSPEEQAAFLMSIQRGLMQGQIAERMKLGETPTREDIIEIARLNKEQRGLKSSKSYERFNEAPFGEAVKIFLQDPLEIGGQIILESGAALARHGYSRALLGGGTGAAMGSVVPGIGTAAGFGTGVVSGLGVAGFNLEMASSILESFEEAGVDITNQYSLESAFSNEETLKKARDFALKRSVPIALFDLFSAGVAGKIAKFPAKSIAKRVAKQGVEMTTQAGLAGTGEAAAQVVSGQKFNPNAILAEMIGETTMAVPEIAVGQMIENKKEGKSIKPEAVKIDTPVEAVRDMVDISVGAGLVTSKEANEIVDEYGKVQEVKKSIPENLRNNEEVVSAIEEKKKLEEDKKTLDPVFTKGVDEKIAALDAKIEGIVSGREVVAADSVVAAEEVISPETGGAPKVEIIAKRRQKLNSDRTKLVPTGGFDYFAKVGDREVKLSDAEYKAYKDSGVLPESVSAVEVTSEVEGEAVTPEAVAPEVPALRDVESTAKALGEAIPKSDQISEAVSALPTVGVINYKDIKTTITSSDYERYFNNPSLLNEKARKIYEELKKGGKLRNDKILLSKDGQLLDGTHRFKARLALGQTNFKYSIPSDNFFTQSYTKTISEAYHKAKADGSNPELVKAVESLLSKAQEVEAQPAQTPEVAEGQPAEVISPEVAEVLSTEDTTRIALESLEVLPEGIESAEEGARIYHEAIGKEERTEAEDAVVMAVEDAVIGGAVAPEVAEAVETAETPKAAEAVTPEEVSTEGVTPEVPGVVEAAEGQKQPSRVATFFSGAGTMEASLPNAQSVMAVEFNPAYVEAYNKAFGVEYEAKDVRDINPEEVIASKPDIFHASPVCKNFSAAKNKRTVLKSDMESADAVARVIREAQPPIVTIENVPDYQGTVPFETIIKALEDAGYTFDVGVYNSADFGGVQNRERLLIRAVKSGELPPIQEKTDPGDWYSAIEDLIESAPDSKFESRSESENWEMARIKDMVRKGKLDATKPIITMGGSASRGLAAAANAGGPAPTLLSTSRSVPRIILPDGTVKRVTPEMMRRLMGLPESYPIPSNPKIAKEVLGNGVDGAFTRALIDPLLNRAEGQPSAETPAQPLTFKEKAKEAKQKADEALKEFDRLTEERRNTGEGISPLGRAERLADLDKKSLKKIIDYLKFAAQSKAYSFADFISQLLERDIVVDYNNPEDRAFYEKHSGKKISEEQPKSIGITNAYDEAAREARGADPIAKKASTTNKQVWDDAMEITKRKDVPAQIAVWAAQDGFVDANPINQALILYDRIRIENEREILLKQIGGASDSQLVSIYERLAALEVETDLNETANKNLGRTWGVTGAFRQALADRAYTITGVIARAKAIGGKSLTAADEVRLTNMAKEIELLQKQKAELEKKLSEELAKERVAAENKVMNEARRKPLPGTTTIEDVKSAYQKWLESKKATGIMFDPKSSAKADIEFLEVVLDYLKSQAINTISKVKKAVKDFTDGGLEVDDEGAAFILEELKARSEAEKPKKPAAKKKPATPKEPSKKIEEKSTDELLSDISEKAEGQIDETNISSLRPYFAQVIRNEVANGAETLDQIVDKIYDKLLETIPSLTKADLKDAMSGYGQYRELSKEELDVKIREVKRIGRLEAALRDVEEKLKLPKRTGVEQDQLSAKARALRQQILKAISDLGITPELTDEELSAKWQSARDAYKRRIENAIADVELEIENKEKKQKKQPTEFNDQEIADLRASLKALREVRDNIPEIKANEADRKLSAKIEATKKKITEAERKIAEGDLSVEETEKLTSPELDALRQDLKGLNEQLSKMREDAKPEAQQISEAQARLDNAARREINRLEALRNKVLADGIGAEDVNAGEIATIKKKKKFPNLKRADALQVQIDNLRRAISDLIPEDVKQEALVQKYLASREKVLERLTEKYNNKDYETKTRPVPPASKEIAAVNRKINEKKKEIETDLERIRLRNRAMIEKLGGGLIDLMALTKSLIASVDLSAPLRQGIVYAVTEPKIFAKVFKDMFKFAFSEKNYQNWLNETKEDPRFDEYTSRYKLHISDQTGKMSAREEQFMSKFFGAFKKIPVYGQLLTGSERAYAGFINKLRWDVFQKYVEEVESMGLTKEEADVELKALAKFVNTATGRGELGVLSSAAVPLNSLLFSPRLVSSRLHPFMMPFLYRKMPKLARQKALKTYATFFGSIITTMVLLSFLMDEDKDEGIELDPRSSDFLKIRFQDYRVDPFGGYQQAIVAIAKLFGGVKSTKTGEVKNFSDEGFGQQTREDIIENYFTNKLAPVPATIYRNYINPSPMDEANKLYSVLFGEVAKDQRSAMRKVGETIFDLTIPLYADDLVGVLSDPDVDLKTGVLSGSAVFGVGGGKYGGKTILRPGSEEFRVMKDMTVAQPRFDTEVKIPEYDVNSNGQIVKVLDEDGKEKKKFLTASQTKVYNEILRKTFTSFVSKMDVDLRESLSETEKKDFADFLLKKAEKIAALQYIADNNSRIKKIVKKRISNSEKAIIEKISEDSGMPYEKLKSKINNALKKTFPKIFEDPQENE
jgi:DNA-cytosine methyltransferase